MKTEQPTATYYSTDGEDFSHTDLEEAAQAHFENDGEFDIGDTATIYEGDGVKSTASEYFIDAIDQMQDEAYEKCGEYAEGWKFTDDQRTSLNEAIRETIDKWCTENQMQPHFWRIEEIREVKVLYTSESGDCEIVKPEDQP